MRRRICTPLMALAAVLALAAGMERSAHAQGALQAFPQPGGTVFVTWLAVPDPNVVGYNLYRREAGVAEDRAVLVNPQQPTTATFIVDAGPDGKGLPLGRPVVYFARAVFRDAAGKLFEGTNSQQAVVTPQNPTVLPAGNFLYYDIDTINPGSVTVEGNVLSIRASGPDLWDRSDGQTFLATPVTGDYQITAALLEKPENVTDNGNGWAKIGVEIRSGPFKGEAFAALFTSVDRAEGVLFEGHKIFGDRALFSQAGTSQDETEFPLYLRLVKQGARITAFQSFDGTNFTQVGDTQDYGTLPPVTYAGVMVTAARDGEYTLARFDANSIKIERK